VLPEAYRSVYPLPNLAVTPEELRWVIKTLSPFFTVMPVTDAVNVIQSSKNFSSILSLSFDDGQWDNVKYALPVLEETGVKGTFYLTTDYINSPQLLWHDRAAFSWKCLVENPSLRARLLGKLEQDSGVSLNLETPSSFVNALKLVGVEEREWLLLELSSVIGEDYPWAGMMSWEDATSLLQAGHEIGSHGMSHSLLPQQSCEEQSDELTKSREKIKAKLGVFPQSFCYPNGDYTEKTLSLLQASGYSNAVTTYWGVNSLPLGINELNRCDMNSSNFANRHGLLSRERLLMRLSGFMRGNGR
jgi:peptidoglycan/xylan/chitin deacetylase (PgdA/CDA1 family)